MTHSKTFTPLPVRMRSLPRDARGYPVPWFVVWINGIPEFRAASQEKWEAAITRRLCWICGRKLLRDVAFVAGPMCGINRTSAEPPAHSDCARWSALNCPFLSNPHAVRREDDTINNTSVRESLPGHALTRNPGVTMLWITRSYELYSAPGGRGKLILLGDPIRVEWYRYGRQATREEVMAAIDAGLPALEHLARQEAGGLAQLERAERRLRAWLPTAFG